MNSIVRMPRGARPQQFSGPPSVGARSGTSVWDGSQWICSPCDDGSAPPFPCPPPGFPPPGCPPWFSGMNSPPWYPGANAGVSFGTVAPPNPVRGHFWWDGVTLWLFDGAAWEAIGGSGSSAGGATPPSTTAPTNPVPGEQWFNGHTLFIWDGNAWVPVSQTKTYIQATAPPAPNPGDTWYNGTQFYVWSGSAWEVVGPGATVGPVATTSVQFAMTATTARTITTNWTIIPFNDQPLTDLQTGWDPVQHMFKPKLAGMYNFMLRGYPGGGSGGGVALLKNDPGTFTMGGLGSDLVIGIDSTSTGGWLNANGFAPMNGTSDYVRAWAWAGAGGTFPTTGSNACFVATLFP
jgi:hypothetical protein